MTNLEQVFRDAEAALRSHRDACSAFLKAHTTSISIDELTAEEIVDARLLFMCTIAAARAIQYPRISEYIEVHEALTLVLAVKLSLSKPHSQTQINNLVEQGLLRPDAAYLHMRPSDQYEQGTGAVN